MGDAGKRDRLLGLIEQEQSRLAGLVRETSASEQRLEALRRELLEMDSVSETRPADVQKPHDPVTATAEGRITVFRSLFRGRADIYATRFVSTKTGKAGYAPACRNKWVEGLCKLPRVKCSECANQAFLPPDDEAIRAHLLGRHVLGVYPMLADETCWFLAIDFDKASWQADVVALTATCRQKGLAPAVERSRSGQGAHVWFFFTAPVPARSARAMGCALITETMASRPELGMDSYDRLFPNQDSMPRGGFGNLIALPLQFEARKEGNSLFVDDLFQPLPDQWQFLAGLERLSPGRVEALVGEAAGHGSVIGTTFVGAAEDDVPADQSPWSRPGGPDPITGPLPPTVRVTLGTRLQVEKVGLPPALINQVKRLAAFQNPEFYKKQNLRLSTALTPRVISCADESPEFVSLPRGCFDHLHGLLKEHGVALTIRDDRSNGVPLELEFKGELTPAQKVAVEALLPFDLGLLVAAPGSGKTVLGTYIAAQRRCGTLILVHRQPLLDQWVAQLALFLGIDAKEIGQIGAGRRKPNGRLDVAMIQSLLRSDEVDDLVGGYGQVIVDECHHVPAVSFERVLNAVKARYLVGLTATPQRRDGHHPIIEMQLGPVRHTMKRDSSTSSAGHAYGLVVRETGFQIARDQGEPKIQELYGALASDEARNSLILDDVLAAVARGRSPLVLSERREHLEWLADRLRPAVRNLVVFTGGATPKARRELIERLAQIPANEERLVLATGRYIGEGFDDARLDTLFLALPVSWKGTVVQYAGRLHRIHPAKTQVYIVDYVDRAVPMLARMHEKRLRTYRTIGYVPHAWPFSGPARREVTLEWIEGGPASGKDGLVDPE